MNRIIIIGNVGQDPTINRLDSGQMVAKLSLATTERWTDKSGEKKELTDWHNVTIWGKLAEVVEKYVKKGDKLMIEGKSRTSSYEKDGVKHYRTDVIGESMEMLGGGQKPNQSEQTQVESDDDINQLPF
jgi:single-strand DNA-binding protein